MSWKSVASTIKKFAPILGSAIPGGSAVTSVISLVAETLDIGNPTPENILKKIAGNPEAQAKLIQLQMNHKTDLKKIALAKDQAYLVGVQHAREREIALAKAGHKDRILPVLSLLLVFGFFSACGVLMYKPLPEGTSEIVYMLLGSLSSGFMAVLGYYFGSSKGSNDKNSMMKR